MVGFDAANKVRGGREHSLHQKIKALTKVSADCQQFLLATFSLCYGFSSRHGSHYRALTVGKRKIIKDWVRERRERGGRGREREIHLFLRVLFLSMLPSDALLKSVLTSLLEEVFTASTSVSGRVSLFFSTNPSATYFTWSAVKWPRNTCTYS